MEYKDPEARGLILLLWALGFPLHRIGALFDCNQGRIAEICRNEPRGKLAIRLQAGRADDD